MLTSHVSLSVASRCYVTQSAAVELMRCLARDRRSVHRIQLIQGLEYLASLPDARKHFQSNEMEPLHAIIEHDVRLDKTNFEVINRYMKACKTSNYINVKLYVSLFDLLSHQRCGVHDKHHLEMSYHNAVELLTNITGVQGPMNGGLSKKHREQQAQLVSAIISHLKYNAPRRFSVNDAASACVAIGMAYSEGLIHHHNWIRSEAFLLLRTLIVPRLISVPPTSLSLNTIVSVLRSCATLPGMCQPGLELLQHYLPLLYSDFKSLEPWQISVILSSIVHLYRDKWVKTNPLALERVTICERDALALRLIRALKSRKHEPSELARIALGVARLLLYDLPVVS